MEPVNLDVLNDVFTNLALKPTPYKWGGSAPSLDADTSLVEGLDCSHFIQFVLARATGGKVAPEPPSDEQHNWASRVLKPCDYLPMISFRDTDILIAFIRPRGKRPGHVWLVRQGWTRECYGSGGVGSRQWNVPILRDNVDGCFILPATK